MLGKYLRLGRKFEDPVDKHKRKPSSMSTEKCRKRSSSLVNLTLMRSEQITLLTDTDSKSERFTVPEGWASTFPKNSLTSTWLAFLEEKQRKCYRQIRVSSERNVTIFFMNTTHLRKNTHHNSSLELLFPDTKLHTETTKLIMQKLPLAFPKFPVHVDQTCRRTQLCKLVNHV